MQTSLPLFEMPLEPLFDGTPASECRPAPAPAAPPSVALNVDWDHEEQYIVLLMARARLTRPAVEAMLRAGTLTPHRRQETA